MQSPPGEIQLAVRSSELPALLRVFLMRYIILFGKPSTRCRPEGSTGTATARHDIGWRSQPEDPDEPEPDGPDDTEGGCRTT